MKIIDIIKLIGNRISEYRFLHTGRDNKEEIHLSGNEGIFTLKDDGTWTFEERP